MRRLLFGGTVFVNAALIFLVQPLAAKALLPRFGGAPAVWSASVAFFQAALLLGYAWSHLLARLAPAKQLALHAGLLLAAAAALPPRALAFDLGDRPVPELLLALAAGVGLPFVAASATSPLLQSWFARTSPDPYFLSSASNLGSLTGLLAYPFGLELHLGLHAQARVWAAGFVAAALLTVASGLSVRGLERPPESGDRPASAPPTTRARLRWLALSLVPSCLLLGVTTHVTANVGAIPLLWVVPLALYLLTYAAAFARSGFPSWVWSVLLPVLVLNAVVLHLLHPDSFWLSGPAHLALFFVAAMACHASLAAERPSAAHVTGFWLVVSLGGVLGGALAAFAAPLIFTSVAEYPLALAAACLLPRGPAAVRVGTALACLVLLRPQTTEVLRAERSFFGVTTVISVVSSGSTERRLLHGDTCHGIQRAETPGDPLAYYHRDGPAGAFFQRLVVPRDGARVALVGLGAGSLAAFARAGQTYACHEIDPAVVRVAEDERGFTFLADARRRSASVPVILGDARLTLARVEAKHRAIVLDAFSGDAIPLHLLTREHLEQVCLPRLEEGGAILVHISNRYVRLAGPVGDLAAALGLAAVQRQDRGKKSLGRWSSHWVALARSRADLEPLRSDGSWVPLGAREAPSYFTDDFSCLVGALELR